MLVLAPHNSSNIKLLVYDNSIQELLVEFHNGQVYCYNDVPMAVMVNLTQAESEGLSVGTIFHKLVKLHPFEFHKIETNNSVA